MFFSKISSTCVRNYSRTVPKTNQATYQNAPKAHSCGISPWNPPIEMPPPPKKQQLPEHLIRPTCLPGSKPGGFQTCDEWKGLYCPPCRLKYKYPPFSENINFVIPKEEGCWWVNTQRTCHPLDHSQLANLSRSGWDCNYE